MTDPSRSTNAFSSMTRRAFGLTTLGVLAGALAGCGGDEPAGGAASPSATTATAASWAPVTVTHAFGTTTVDSVPSRVVAAGYTEQDFLLALGVTPIAVTEWYGEHPHATWPWARDELGSAKPKVLSLGDDFQFVDIAATRPDLIVGVNSGMQKQAYDKLSKIAPTVAPASAAEGWFPPWPEMLTVIAQAVGRPADGERILADVRGAFTGAAAANPAFAGKKAIFLQNAVYDGSLIAYQRGLSTEFLTDLGFEVPAEIDEFVRDGEQAYIPVERISVLDSADVLVWGTESDSDRTALEKVPGFTNLAAVKGNRSIYTGGELAGAIYFASPLSLPYVVDRLVPMLAKAFA